MASCSECSVSFRDRKLFAEHMEIHHRTSFDAGITPFIKKYQKGGYKEFEMKFTTEERSQMKSFDQLYDRLKVELFKIPKIIILPGYLSVKLDMTLTKTNSETSVQSFHKIRVQGRSFFYI
jgi:hypothetical protein